MGVPNNQSSLIATTDVKHTQRDNLGRDGTEGRFEIRHNLQKRIRNSNLRTYQYRIGRCLSDAHFQVFVWQTVLLWVWRKDNDVTYKVLRRTKYNKDKGGNKKPSI